MLQEKCDPSKSLGSLREICMRIFNPIKAIAILLIVLLQFASILPQKATAATTTVNLGTATSFAVLAGSAVNATNPSTVIGDVGLSPTTGAAIGITAAEVTGTIYAVDGFGPGGSINNPGLLTTAKNDLTTAYNDAANRPTTSTIATNLGGATLTDGVYHAASDTFSITLGQTLTLDGEGNADSVFIFKMGTTLVTGAASSVVLTNGAQACNVFWQVGSSATLGTGTSFVGNILADQSITDDGGSTVNGRLLTSSAAVTVNNTDITASNCASTPSTTTDSSSADGDGLGGPSANFCPALNYVSPTVIESRRIDADSISISWGPYSGTDAFSVRYGYKNGEWLYSTNVTGFSTTINELTENQPVWVQVAARNDCSVGEYGQAVLAPGPLLPDAGVSPSRYSFTGYLIAGFSTASSFLLKLFYR